MGSGIDDRQQSSNSRNIDAHGDNISKLCDILSKVKAVVNRQDGTTGKDSNIILKGGCKNISDSVPLRFPWSATGGWHGSRRNPCEQESGT